VTPLKVMLPSYDEWDMSEHVVLPRPPFRLRQPSIGHSTVGECPGGGTERATTGLRRRGVAVVVAVGVVALGILYFFCYDPVFRHSATWTDPSDLWGTFRAAHYVGWGFLGGIYNQETGMVTFPGIAVVLAPVAGLTDALHMSSSIEAIPLAHPTAALLLVPTVLVLASTVVVAADALADELGVNVVRRAVLAVLVGAMAWAATIVWGHPEDALVMTFGCWAMAAVLRGNWRRAGWLFGVGIAFQPLIALTIPLFLAATPRGQRVLFALRCSVLSAFLVGVAFLGNPSGTYRALIEQPTPPHFNHASPWVSLAPHVILPGAGSASSGAGLARSASGAFLHVALPTRALLQVAAGPGRTVYLLLAVLAGLYVWRRPQDPVRLLWLAGVVLGARCFFEAVMTPYYLTPPLILLLVLAARRGTGRFTASVVVAAGISWFAYWHLAPWVWWPPIAVGMTVVMALSRPPVSPVGDGEMERTAPVQSSERGTSAELEPVA
jgi:hypothetical protein